MAAQPNPNDTPVPTGSLVFGYGPMLPLGLAALGAWALAPAYARLATTLAILWGAMILVFVAGVRRGFGFGATQASTANEMATMLVYFVLGGLALVLSTFRQPAAALTLLSLGFVLVALFDTRAAFTGDAPAHFARLRAPQMTIASVALVLLLVRQLTKLHGAGLE
jgi:hypothetical protein